MRAWLNSRTQYGLTVRYNIACRQPRERCVATIKAHQHKRCNERCHQPHGKRPANTLRTCLSAAKQFDTVLEIWAVIVRQSRDKFRGREQWTPHHTKTFVQPMLLIRVYAYRMVLWGKYVVSPQG